MKRITKEKVFLIMAYVLLFFVLLMGSLIVIRSILDAQMPNLDKLLEAGESRIFDLNIFSFKLQTVIFEINGDGSYIIDVNNYPLFYLMPIILTSILTLISGSIINKIRKYTESWKI